MNLVDIFCLECTNLENYSIVITYNKETDIIYLFVCYF